MEQGDFMVRAVAGFRRHELENGNAVKGPPMARGDQAKLRLAFGERDVEDLFASLHTFEEELECKRGLAGSRGAFDEIKPVGVKTAAQNVVQARHTGRILSSILPSCDAMRLTRQSAHRLTKFALTQSPASANGSRFAASHGTPPGPFRSPHAGASALMTAPTPHPL